MTIMLSLEDRWNYARLPLLGALKAYVEKRQPVGGFLTAILENDLSAASARADASNIWLLPIYVAWLYNEAPASCWGSPEKVTAWLNPPESASPPGQADGRDLPARNEWERASGRRKGE